MHLNKSSIFLFEKIIIIFFFIRMLIHFIRLTNKTLNYFVDKFYLVE
jgi:hypothetical protein